MAFAFIGQTVASSIIGKVVEAAYTAVQENLLPAGIEADLKKLHDALPDIQEVLRAVERGEINNQNKALTKWMWQFRDAVESAEDVLDEMAYYELEEKIQHQNEKVGSFASRLKRKVGTFVNHMFKAYDHGTSKRLAMAVKGLEKVASSVHYFLDLQRGPGKFHGEISDVKNNCETSSMITECEVFGRVKERDSIVQWLTANDPVTLSAYTISGIGGFGKTTLAQLIYKDRMVEQFFNPIIWVCVSAQFDAVTIIGKILESREVPTTRSLNFLQNTLKERLMSKRFLLVLDDVWNDENDSEWKKVVAPLKFGNGKILITTRMESVADMVANVIEGKKNHLNLGGLEEKEFSMLFNKHAFDGFDYNKYKCLHPIGMQIMKKLGGYPLSAKIMGGVLNTSMNLRHWNKILKEDVSEFKGDIRMVLRLSYYYLPTYLQLCFRYCSIFPKDYAFRKDELIKMWMGSGLIEPLDERQMSDDVGRHEDIGRRYFNLLVRKSFFNLKWKDYYVMHDLLHDLAQSVSEGECLRIEKSCPYIPKTIRHLSFKAESLLFIKKISSRKNLRTLFITFCGNNPNSHDINIFSEVLQTLKSLRLLRIKVIMTGVFKVPDTIGELIHLRYLSHESNRTVELPWFPVSVYKLYYLEIIKFATKCHHKDMEEHEINGMVNLINLRYLDVGSNILRQIPFIGKLVSLLELQSFHTRPKIGHMISEMRDLQSLRKLAIYNLNTISDPADAEEAKINRKGNLNNLSLNWSENSFHRNNQGSPPVPPVNEQLADKLKPHTHLQNLVIHYYGGRRYPIWMTDISLRNLLSLKLSNCFLLSSLPALGNLPLLEDLCLHDFTQVEKIDQTFYGDGTGCAFKALKNLELVRMHELKEWEEVQGMTLFPELEKLVVRNCDKLRRLPSLPPSLNKLDISYVGLEILPRIYVNNNGIISPSSLSYLSVKSCPNLTSFDGCLLQQQELLQALSILSIDNCERLMHLPARGFIDFTSIKDLTIRKCPILGGAPNTQETLLPSSLQKLTVGQCGLEVPLIWSVQNFTALTKLELDGCRNISSLPLFETLTTLIALYELSISDCTELSSLSGLEVLTSLRCLTIENCDNLTTMSLSQPPLLAIANGDNLLGLDNLSIDRATLLLLVPLRSLRLTKRFSITNDSGLTCMPEEWLKQNCSTLSYINVFNANSLENLPSCMYELQMLERLEIKNAQLIQSLPELPLSLNFLLIKGCGRVLKKQCERDSGPEWYRIEFIPHVELD